MNLKKMLFDETISLITFIELLIYWLLYLILPIWLFIILLIIIPVYLGYRLLLISKSSQNIDGMIEHNSNTMKAAYYSNSWSKIIDFGYYLKPILIGSHDLLIKVHSAALNPVDYKVQFSKIPFYRWLIFPNLGIGKDFSGEVIQVGSKVTKFKEGDNVYGFSSMGSFQEYTITKEKWVRLKPQNLSFPQAAALPLAAGTAYQALSWFFKESNNSEYFYERVDLRGKIVLIIGASGGTGHLAVQIAKFLGAEVYGICSQSNVELVRSLGNIHVLAYNSENFVQELENNFKSSLGENKLDLIIDTVTSFKDGDIGVLYKKYLKAPEEENSEGGKYVALNSTNPIKFFIGSICSFYPSLSWEKKGEHIHLLNRNDNKALDEINKMVSEGALKPFINNINFEHSSIDEGINLLKSRRVRGKLVCNIFSE